MAKKKRPRDTNQLAKAIVDEATSEEKVDVAESPKATSGRKGGLKGGTARAVKLSKERRSQIAKKAAMSRWKKDSS